MKALFLGLLFIFVQQGMGPGPGTPHSAGGGGGIAFVQSAQNSTHSAATTISVTLTATTATNLLVAACYDMSSTGTMAISDSHGSTWTAGTSTTETTFNSSLFPYYLSNNAGGITTVTCTSSANVTQRLVVMEFSGVSALDGTQQNATTASFATPAVWSTPTITTTNANDLIVSMTGDGGGVTYSAGSLWTLPTNGQTADTHGNLALQYRIVSATSTYASSGSALPGGNDNFLSSLFAYK